MRQSLACCVEAVLLFALGTDQTMSSHTQLRASSRSIAGSTKKARGVSDSTRGTVMARALLNAFEFSKRKIRNTTGSDNSQWAKDEQLPLDKGVKSRFRENPLTKLNGTLDVTAILSKAAGFPINVSCLSAFGDIGTPAIVELLRAAKFKKVRTKSIVYREGESLSGVTYILEGSLTAYRYSPDGRELVLDYLGRGDFIGEATMLRGNASYKASFKAREECKIAEIASSDFQQICQRHPECLFRMTTQLAQRLHCSDDRIYDLVFLDVTGRVENALQYLADSPAAITHPSGMQVRITRQEIGSLVGCSREMVGRAIKELSAAEKISVDGKNIVVFGEL